MHEHPHVVVILDHRDCIPVVIPTYGGTIMEVNEYSLEDAWLMFDHVNMVQGWTTVAFYVYDPSCRFVLTSIMCNM